MACQIVHDDDVARAQGGDHELLDVGAEAVAIHRTVQCTGCADLTEPQGGDEGRGLPMAPRHAGNQALAARAASVTPRHVGRSARFVDEDQAFWVQFGLAGMPLRAGRGDIRPILFGGAL